MCYMWNDNNCVCLFTAEHVKPAFAVTTTIKSDECLSLPPAAKRKATHDDVFSRLDNRRDGVFSRLDNRNSITRSDDRHSNNSDEVTSSLETTQQQQSITTIISKRKIKLTEIKENAVSSSPPPAAHVTSVHQPPTNKVVCDCYSYYS